VIPAEVAVRCVLAVLLVAAVFTSRRCVLDSIDLPVIGRTMAGGGTLGPATGGVASGSARAAIENANGMLLGLFLPLRAGGSRGS